MISVGLHGADSRSVSVEPVQQLDECLALADKVRDWRVVHGAGVNADKTLEIDDICKTLRISRSTFYRYVRL